MVAGWTAQLIDKKEYFIQTDIPVSYTHLDVYKRQEETSTGIYEMSHILYGGVFVRETKAPESFLLDENAYYVEITENGKIYEVEDVYKRQPDCHAPCGGAVLPAKRRTGRLVRYHGRDGPVSYTHLH